VRKDGIPRKIFDTKFLLGCGLTEVNFLKHRHCRLWKDAVTINRGRMLTCRTDIHATITPLGVEKEPNPSVSEQSRTG
jgi:hypothetical protein